MSQQTLDPEQEIEETKAKANTPQGRLEILWDAVQALVTGADLAAARHAFDPDTYAPAPVPAADAAAQDREIAALEDRLAAAQRAKRIAELEGKVAEAEGGPASTEAPASTPAAADDPFATPPEVTS